MSENLKETQQFIEQISSEDNNSLPMDAKKAKLIKEYQSLRIMIGDFVKEISKVYKQLRKFESDGQQEEVKEMNLFNGSYIVSFSHRDDYTLIQGIHATETKGIKTTIIEGDGFQYKICASKSRRELFVGPRVVPVEDLINWYAMDRTYCVSESVYTTLLNKLVTLGVTLDNLLEFESLCKRHASQIE